MSNFFSTGLSRVSGLTFPKGPSGSHVTTNPVVSAVVPSLQGGQSRDHVNVKTLIPPPVGVCEALTPLTNVLSLGTERHRSLGGHVICQGSLSTKGP